MGFGVLFFGYFVMFAFSLSTMYFFADIIGYALPPGRGRHFAGPFGRYMTRRSGWRLRCVILLAWFRLRGGVSSPIGLCESTAADRAAADMRGGETAY